jgi:hypothetical protein
MKVKNNNRIIFSGAIATALALGWCSVAQTQEVVVGWIEKPNYSSFRLIRNGKELASNQADLYACDKVRLIDDSAVVRITLAASFRRLQLDNRVPSKEVVIGCDEVPSSTGKFLGVLRIISGRASASNDDERRTAAATKGVEASPVAVPAFGNYEPLIVAGRDELTVSIRGGEAPFALRLMRYGTDQTLTTIGPATGTTHKLSVRGLPPGRYVLEVKDHKGNGLQERSLIIVPITSRPKPPSALFEANLPLAEEQLLYSYFLEAYGAGEWTFEALQIAASISKPTPATLLWLKSRFAVE